MGLATFLLHMVQLQASVKKYKVNIYLQSNISSQAFKWYKHRGFNLAPTNSLEELPEKIRNWHTMSQSKTITEPYVHFVTTEKWNYEVEQMGHKPLSEEWQKQRLLLIHLDTAINLRGSAIDVDIATTKSDKLIVIHKVLPSKETDTFLTFPFRECASRINQATKGMIFLMIHFSSFRMMKKNLVKGN